MGFVDFIGEIRKRDGPSVAQADQLREIMLASVSEDAYLLSQSNRSLWDRLETTGEEGIKRHRREWLAALLAHVRPDEIDPKTLSRTDRHEISRIAETFVRLPSGPQRRIVRQLFSTDIKLEAVAKTGRLPRRPISDKTRVAFTETMELRGKRRAEALTRMEADYWSPKSAKEAYDENPMAFYKDLYDLKSRILAKPEKKKNPKSSPALD